MFSFFKKNPLKELNKQYLQKLEEAMHAQRNGDIRTYSMLTSEGEEYLKQIEELEKQQNR
jgi:predicted transcriptional regulator